MQKNVRDKANARVEGFLVKMMENPVEIKNDKNVQFEKVLRENKGEKPFIGTNHFYFKNNNWDNQWKHHNSLIQDGQYERDVSF